jgi:hypothetical protein|tara:strand:+ start:2157 stop:2369 length:213 start_codon:yes stop_codon:yes gene_type:complete
MNTCCDRANPLACVIENVVVADVVPSDDSDSTLLSRPGCVFANPSTPVADPHSPSPHVSINRCFIGRNPA